jgi:hypothetical protein
MLVAARILICLIALAAPLAASQIAQSPTQNTTQAAQTQQTQTSGQSGGTPPFQAGQGVTAPPAISLLGPAAIRFDASQSHGEAAIRIVSTADRKLVLHAGPLSDKQSKEVVPGLIVLEPAELTLAANVPQTVTAKASGVFVDGDAEFDIFAGPHRVGPVTVTRGPFAVSVAETTPTFQSGRRTALTLRNDSRYAHNLRWMAHLGAHRYCGQSSPNCKDDASNWGVVTIPAKDSQTIHIDPPATWFDGSVIDRPAEVWLSLAPDVAMPKRVQKLNATLVGPYVPWQWLFILTMLFLGAMFSLIVRHWVPNTQRKRDLKEQTRRVRSKIDAFSDDIDYELRAQTRVQGHLLESLRKSAWTVMPHYASVASQCAAGLSMLEKRVDLIEEVDSVYAIERVKWQSCPPPSQIDRVEETLRGALEALKKAHLLEPEFTAITAEIDRARALTNRMGAEDAEFGKDLATRLHAMVNELKSYSDTAPYQDLAASLPGLFRTVTAADANGAALDVSPLRYSLLDYNLSALQICRDYIWLASGAATSEKLTTDIKTALIQHLSRQSWGELRLARLLLKQFRENSYEEQVWQAIQAGDEGIYVVHEPTDLHSLQLVQFRIYFRRSELNWAGAKDLIAPEWQFSDGSRPRGWAISHFFTDRRTSPRKWWERWQRWRAGETPHWIETVAVNFEAPPGVADDKVRRLKAAIQLRLSVRHNGADDPRSRTVSEALGLAVSIFIPLVALMASAKEQLAQNPAGGALMIFLLGFSSDALISVFKQRAAGS